MHIFNFWNNIYHIYPRTSGVILVWNSDFDCTVFWKKYSVFLLMNLEHCIRMNCKIWWKASIFTLVRNTDHLIPFMFFLPQNLLSICLNDKSGMNWHACWNKYCTFSLVNVWLLRNGQITKFMQNYNLKFKKYFKN